AMGRFGRRGHGAGDAPAGNSQRRYHGENHDANGRRIVGSFHVHLSPAPFRKSCAGALSVKTGYALIITTISDSIFSWRRVLNSSPTTGISLRIGTPFSDRRTSVRSSPPITNSSPSLSRTVVSASRLDVWGKPSTMLVTVLTTGWTFRVTCPSGWTLGRT